MRLAIAIPTYNEISNIAGLLEALLEVSTRNRDAFFKILVIDDSSPDGTADLVKVLSNSMRCGNFEILMPLARNVKEGLGKAYVHGFNELLSSDGFDYILQMDADLSHDPQYITEFIKAAREGTDLVIGTRYQKGGGTPDWNFFRRFLSRWGNTYARMILGSAVSDYTGGFNMYSTALLKRLNLNNISSKGYGFLIELKYKAASLSEKIAEVPIVFMDRTSGASKIPKSTILEDFLLVLKLRLKNNNQ
jgi:dolichol-phosphate mannosyltransferase